MALLLKRESDTEALKSLELDGNPTKDEIVKAFKRLALQYHPDKNPDDTAAARKFLEIGRALYHLIRCSSYVEHQIFSFVDEYIDDYDDDDDDDDDEDWEDLSDADDEIYSDDEEAIDGYKRIFMEVLAKSVIKRKYCSKKKRRQSTQEEEEEEEFFYFLNKKRREEDDDEDEFMTEEDLKRFHSYEEWKTEDNKRKKSKKKKKGSKLEKVPQTGRPVLTKKQLQAEQRRREQEMKMIGEELAKKYNTVSDKKPSPVKTCVPKPKSFMATDAGILKEIQEQQEQKQIDKEKFEQRIKQIDAREKRAEKRRKRKEKRHVKQRQLQLFDTQEDEQVSETEAKVALGKARIGQPLKRMEFPSQPKLHNNPVRDKTSKSSVLQSHFKVPEPSTVTTDTDWSPVTTHTTATESGPVSKKSKNDPKLMEKHMKMYNDLMRVQPQRHTEQQLRQERNAQKKQQQMIHQEELDRLRGNQKLQLFSQPAKTSTIHESTVTKCSRQELLQKHREMERRRNEEEEEFICKGESVDGTKRKACHGNVEPVKQATPVPARNQTRVFAYNPVATQENIWRKRQVEMERRNEELSHLMPQSADMEARMIQMAMKQSMQTAEQANDFGVGVKNEPTVKKQRTTTSNEETVSQETVSSTKQPSLKNTGSDNSRGSTDDSKTCASKEDDERLSDTDETGSWDKETDQDWESVWDVEAPQQASVLPVSAPQQVSVVPVPAPQRTPLGSVSDSSSQYESCRSSITSEDFAEMIDESDMNGKETDTQVCDGNAPVNKGNEEDKDGLGTVNKDNKSLGEVNTDNERLDTVNKDNVRHGAMIKDKERLCAGNKNEKDNLTLGAVNKDNVRLGVGKKNNERLDSTNKDNERLGMVNKDNKRLDKENKDNVRAGTVNKDNRRLGEENKDNERLDTVNKDNVRLGAMNKDKERLDAGNKDQERLSTMNKDKGRLGEVNKENERLCTVNKNNQRPGAGNTYNEKDNERLGAVNKYNEKVKERLSAGNKDERLGAINKDKENDNERLAAVNKYNEKVKERLGPVNKYKERVGSVNNGSKRLGVFPSFPASFSGHSGVWELTDTDLTLMTKVEKQTEQSTSAPEWKVNTNTSQLRSAQLARLNDPASCSRSVVGEASSVSPDDNITNAIKVERSKTSADQNSASSIKMGDVENTAASNSQCDNIAFTNIPVKSEPANEASPTSNSTSPVSSTASSTNPACPTVTKGAFPVGLPMHLQQAYSQYLQQTSNVGMMQGAGDYQVTGAMFNPLFNPLMMSKYVNEQFRSMPQFGGQFQSAQLNQLFNPLVQNTQSSGNTSDTQTRNPSLPLQPQIIVHGALNKTTALQPQDLQSTQHALTSQDKTELPTKQEPMLAPFQPVSKVNKPTVSIKEKECDLGNDAGQENIRLPKAPSMFIRPNLNADVHSQGGPVRSAQAEASNSLTSRNISQHQQPLSWRSNMKTPPVKADQNPIFPVKADQNPNSPVKAGQNPNFPVKADQNPNFLVKADQSPTFPVKADQNPFNVCRSEKASKEDFSSDRSGSRVGTRAAARPGRVYIPPHKRLENNTPNIGKDDDRNIRPTVNTAENNGGVRRGGFGCPPAKRVWGATNSVGQNDQGSKGNSNFSSAGNTVGRQDNVRTRAGFSGPTHGHTAPERTTAGEKMTDVYRTSNTAANTTEGNNRVKRTGGFGCPPPKQTLNTREHSGQECKDGYSGRSVGKRREGMWDPQRENRNPVQGSEQTGIYVGIRSTASTKHETRNNPRWGAERQRENLTQTACVNEQGQRPKRIEDSSSRVLYQPQSNTATGNAYSADQMSQNIEMRSFDKTKDEVWRARVRETSGEQGIGSWQLKDSLSKSGLLASRNTPTELAAEAIVSAGKLAGPAQSTLRNTTNVNAPVKMMNTQQVTAVGIRQTREAQSQNMSTRSNFNLKHDANKQPDVPLSHGNDMVWHLPERVGGNPPGLSEKFASIGTRPNDQVSALPAARRCRQRMDRNLAVMKMLEEMRLEQEEPEQSEESSDQRSY